MNDAEIVRLVDGYVAALRAGRDVDPASIVKAHPHLGPGLPAALAAARTIAALAAARAAGRPAREVDPVLRSRYERITPVDRGGMGIVLRAHDPALGRDVALKTLPEAAEGPPTTPDERLRGVHARLRREARLTAALEHPGVPPVYEVGASSDGTPYYAMRLVARERRTLATEIDALHGVRFEGRAGLLDAFLRVCDTVAYAHAKGIVHRDLKPENVVVGDYGVVFVVDWGLAAWKGQADPDVAPAPEPVIGQADGPLARLTQLGSVLGSAGYLSPEAATGHMADFDERSEVYSLGAMLFEILTGSLPHEFTSRSEYLERVRSRPPRVASDLDPTIPRSLSELCEAALSIDRSRRPVSVEKMAQEIRAWRARSDADREALRRISEARVALGRVPTLAPEEARHAVGRALALVESMPGIAVEHPDVESVRAECARTTAELDAAERRRGAALGAARRRRQRRWAAAVGLVLLGLGIQRVVVSRAEGEADAHREAVRRKRASIEDTIDRMSRDGPAGYSNDLHYVLRLARDVDAETVDVIARTLDGVSDELAAARARAANEPVTEGTEEGVHIRGWQDRLVSRGRRRLAHLLCEALGHAGERVTSVPALARHLEAQYDPDGLISAGRALARLAGATEGGREALAALQTVAAARGLDADAEFRAQVLSYLPVAYQAPSAVVPVQIPPKPPPRPPHGVLPDPVSGADWLVPAYVESWIGLGIPRDGRRELRDQLRDFSARIEAAPLEASNWIRRAGVGRYLGDLAGADADLTRAIELDPRATEAIHMRAGVRRLRGDHHGAIHDSDTLLARGGDPTAALLLRGIAWTDLGDAARAIADFDAVIGGTGPPGAAYAYRAMARLDTGDAAGAERDGVRATETDPENAEGWNVLAVARLLLGRDAEAVEAATTATRHGAAYTLAWNTLGVARCRAGDVAGGRAALEEANRLDAGLPFAWVNLGVCELRAGAHAAARTQFEWAIERCDARLASPWLGLWIACRSGGDADRARHARDVFGWLAPGDPRASSRSADPPVPPGKK